MVRQKLSFFGFEKVNYEYEFFEIDLSELYHFEFVGESEVRITIFRDLNDYADKLYSNEKEREIYIQKEEIDSIIKTLKIELKSILIIIKRSVKTLKLSVKIHNQIALTIFSK